MQQTPSLRLPVPLATHPLASPSSLSMRAGEFVITHPSVQVPPRGAIYSINEGNAVNWDEATKK